jgi:hypothetical protein
MFFSRRRRMADPAPQQPIRFLDESPVPCVPWWRQGRCRRAAAPAAAMVKPEAIAPAPKREATAPEAGTKAAVAPPPAPKKRREWPIGTLAFLTVLGTGLVAREKGWAGLGRAEVTQELTDSFSVGDSPLVIVETFNGGIAVKRGVSGQVECRVVKRARGETSEAAQAELERLNVEMGKVGETIRVAAKPPTPGGGNASATIDLIVPQGASVRLKSTNGGIRVEQTAGPVQAETANGAIHLRDVTGALNLVAANGSIDCNARDAVIQAETANGSIDFEGSLADGSSSFQTRNGSVQLGFPDHQSFSVDAQTDHGKVKSDFDIALESRQGKRSKHLVGRVGDDPKARVLVRTSNGSIELRERDRD